MTLQKRTTSHSLSEAEIFETIAALERSGMPVTYRGIREALGNRGSFATIQKALANRLSDPGQARLLAETVTKLKKELEAERFARMKVELELDQLREQLVQAVIAH